MYQLITFAALLFFIALHEFGHLLVARACKVRVTDYSIGFGKTLYSFRWKNINWYLKLFPLGGYVKMPGMLRDKAELKRIFGKKDGETTPYTVGGKPLTENQQMDYLYATGLVDKTVSTEYRQELVEKYGPDTFHRANIFKRVAILLGGCAVNIATAALLIFISVWAFTPLMSERWELRSVSAENKAEYSQYVGQRMIQFDNAGYMRNDGSGQKLATLDAPKNHHMIVLESGKKLYIPAGDKTSVVISKVKSERIGYRDIPASVAATYSWQTVKSGFIRMASFLPDFFSSGEKGKTTRDQTSSAIGMVSESPNQKANFLWYLGILSLSLGIFNLLPLVPLDGGQIIFNIVQSLKVPLGEKAYGTFALAGVAIFIMVMFTAVSNDITRLIH